MSKVVIIYELNAQGKDVVAGRLIWDGKTISANPPDSLLLKNIIAHPVIAQQVTGDAMIKLTATDGDKFLAGLQYQYKSGYLRASAPKTAE
jgi:hypothetical protein